MFVGPDLYVCLLPVYYCMCLRSEGIDSLGITMEWDRFSQQVCLHFIPGGGAQALQKGHAFPAPASEIGGSRPIWL